MVTVIVKYVVVYSTSGSLATLPDVLVSPLLLMLVSPLLSISNTNLWHSSQLLTIPLRIH